MSKTQMSKYLIFTNITPSLKHLYNTEPTKLSVERLNKLKSNYNLINIIELRKYISLYYIEDELKLQRIYKNIPLKNIFFHLDDEFFNFLEESKVYNTYPSFNKFPNKRFGYGNKQQNKQLNSHPDDDIKKYSKEKYKQYKNLKKRYKKFKKQIKNK